jgi:Rps23 Pro-64 3,4-dihydroxylase Tpa1-like proline 4-hydroxylase
VIPTLINPTLLHAVKNEILEHLSFTAKETDIYRLHQTGDLANLSGLPAELAAKLPSLRRLRDALYSQTFRDYIVGISGCGPLSGTKTDMAINVYTPGCHLLTHDDVIGSRRVSYILYLCGSEKEPWKPEWGGALRLYPTEKDADGTKVPTAEWSRVCPPAWNQLAFFEVVPGESFHDVEEVYDPKDGSERTRMAISGWFHIPQHGEEGFVEGLEEELGKKSSLASLQTKNDRYDRPQPQVVPYPEDEEEGFSSEELEFLVKYINPMFLQPKPLRQIAKQFTEESCIHIGSFLRNKFEAAVRTYIESQDTKPSSWPVAVPPHKQKYLYLQSSPKEKAEEKMSPIEELLTVLLPSKEFRKLLQIATKLKLNSHNLLGRRFRKGMDYTLATGMHPAQKDEENPIQLELCLNLTPTDGWEPTEPAKEEEEPKPKKKKKGKSRLNPDYKPEEDEKVEEKKPKRFDDSARTVGGYEMYMAAEDDDPTNDPAVYKASAEEDGEDDGVLFMNYPGWNTLSLALRDQGTLKFVKYVSAAAKGDRWDVVGEFAAEVNDDEDSEEDEDEDEEVDEDEDEDEEDGEGDGDNDSDSYDGRYDDEEEWRGCSP